MATAQPKGTGPWPVSAETDQGFAAGTFQELVNRINEDPGFTRARALLLVRHGTLVGEAYFNGTQSNDLHDLRSVTKSVTSMATGIAIARGEVPSVQAKIKDLLPAYAQHLVGRAQEQLNLEQVLTMQAGLEWDDTEDPWLGQLFTATDLVDYSLSRPTVAVPGTVFEYSSALSQVLAKVLIERSGRTLHDYVRQHLFAPIGINQSNWLLRPSDDHFGGLGMRIKPLDMARLGQLAMQRGYWSGRQVVERSWMDASIRDFRGSSFGYGYQWWRLGPERFTAIGYGGQYIDIDRSTDTVLCLVMEWNVPATQQVGLTSFNSLRDLMIAGVRNEAANAVTVRSLDGQLITELRLTEGDSPTTTTVVLHREGPADGALTVRVDTRNGSARRHRDFDPVAEMLRWEAGDAEPRPVDLVVLNDSHTEQEERFFLDLERITGNGQVNTPSVVITIVDAPPISTSLDWSHSFAAIGEGETSTVTLVRSGAIMLPLSVPVTMRGVTANAADFESPAPTSFEFAAGQASASIELAATADDGPEPAEIFELELGTDPASLVHPAALSGVIIDQDPIGCDLGASTDASCFLANRYKAEVVWRAPNLDKQGSGAFAPLEGFIDQPGAQSAQVSFFGSNNVELLIKMLDGTSINGSAWMFFGKMSDLPVWVVVRDLDTGRVALWHSEDRSLCGVADIGAFTPSTDTQLSTTRDAVQAEPEPSTSGELFSLQPASTDGGPCRSDAICLHDRFEVRIRWISDAPTAFANPVMTTVDTGAFWMFNPGNVEVGVKILDARVINGHFWFFAGSLTDQSYAIEVLDLETTTLHTFENTGGDLCGFAETGLL